MYPQAFLKTFWRMELRPQVFVAMSFACKYERRFNEVIAPAISSLTVNGAQLQPHRVNTSKSGDSILTEIIDGIAHSRLVLADVSSIGKDSVTGEPYRNGNVMYEVGLALACRHPAEVLLVRDDRDRFLFDVSTIPHATIQFEDVDPARDALSGELATRLKEQELMRDARVWRATSSLSVEEVKLLRQIEEDPIWGLEITGTIASVYAHAIGRLLDKGIIILAGEFSKDVPAYKTTPLGCRVHEVVSSRLPKFDRAIESDNESSSQSDEEDGQ